MALIICRECGKEISDKALRCPNCGCPSMDNLPLEQKNSTDSSRKRKRLILILLPIILLCVIIIVVVNPFKNSEKKDDTQKEDEAKYNEANQLQVLESFAEAKAIYDTISEYKDSADRSIYCQAQLLSRKGKYKEAYDLLREIPDYSETKELLLLFYYETRFLEALPEYCRRMKNPDSLKIISVDIYYGEKPEFPVFIMNAGGQNGFGGYATSYSIFAESQEDKHYVCRGICRSLDKSTYNLKTSSEVEELVVVELINMTFDQFDRHDNLIDYKRILGIVESKDFQNIKRIETLSISDVMEAIMNRDATTE